MPRLEERHTIPKILVVAKWGHKPEAESVLHERAFIWWEVQPKRCQFLYAQDSRR